MLTTSSGSTALLTDRYELTMLDAARRSGLADAETTFELFSRRLPAGRRFGVVAGTGRFLDALSEFRFDDVTLGELERSNIVSADTLAWLADWHFEGDVWGYREGELYFPHSPVLTVTGRFADATLIETLALSIFNHDSAIASAAARMRLAAGGRRLVDMGSRRTHEEAAVAAARAAYVAGFDATSNLQAGANYGIPTIGTAAHAFTLAHPSELEAFEAQIAALGVGTTLLVDTYDIKAGIDTAVAAARAAGATGPGGIRIDSGDLAVEVEKARAQLDALGATNTRIVVSSDLDEYEIERLAKTPVDVFGVGTRLVGGSGHPTCGFVYKLVAIDRGNGPVDVAKASSGKASVGGRKVAWRELDSDGKACGEAVVPRHVVPGSIGDTPTARGLQVRLVEHGERIDHTTLDQARAHHRAAVAELRPMHTGISDGRSAFVGVAH